MIVLKDKITRKELGKYIRPDFGGLVKAVVDVERRLIAIDSELHSDLESFLLDDGSRQADLWGINLYPEVDPEDLIEFDSLINIRPAQGNPSRGVEDEALRKRIRAITAEWIIS